MRLLGSSTRPLFEKLLTASKPSAPAPLDVSANVATVEVNADRERIVRGRTENHTPSTRPISPLALSRARRRANGSSPSTTVAVPLCRRWPTVTLTHGSARTFWT